MLVGPAIAGLVIARWSTTAAYVLDAAAIAVSLYGVARLPSMKPEGRTSAVGLRGMWEGCRFIRCHPALSGSLATDLAATVLAMPIALFPMLNEQRFGGDPQTLGLFLSAIAAGGILASLTSGPVTRARRLGRVQLVAAATWGLALAGFGFADTLIPTVACLAVAGAADTISVISRGTVIQLATPEAYLGRASSGGVHRGSRRTRHRQCPSRSAGRPHVGPAGRGHRRSGLRLRRCRAGRDQSDTAPLEAR